mgnify:CR=1 FL=1
MTQALVQKKIIPRTIMTGFIGGVFWSAIWVVIHYLNFTELSPNYFILRSWLKTDWTSGWIGQIISIIVIGVLSIIPAYIYFLLFKKINHLWIGIVFGIALWGLFMVLLQLFPSIKNFNQLEFDTIITMLCLSVLYGIFVGYSISYDYYETFVLKKSYD